MNKIILLILVSYIASVNSYTTLGNADRATVAAAVTAATAGDTIGLPVDIATWDTCVYITKQLSIIGAGYTKTQINNANRHALTKGFFNISGITDTSKMMRISGIRFNMDTTGYRAIMFNQTTTLKKLRIDSNYFAYGTGGINAYGIQGVIDNNVFYNLGIAIEFDAGSRAQADTSWNVLTPGTSNFLFIESNSFIKNDSISPQTMDEQIATENGGNLCIRYNNFDGSNYRSTQFWPIMTHGNGGAGGLMYWSANSSARRGQPIVEIYNNTLSGYVNCRITLRGSSNLIFNNTITAGGGLDNILELREEEQDYGLAGATPRRRAWPAEDQIHNSFFWNNTVNGSPLTISHIYMDKAVDSTADTIFMHLNRDFFLHAPIDTGGCEVFTNRNGAAGSFPTDGTIYANTGTMEFHHDTCNAYYGYMPYTYPNPLRNASAPVVSRKCQKAIRISRTRLRVSLPAALWEAWAGGAEVGVFDIAGKLLASQSAGIRRITPVIFDVSRFPAGTYFVRLKIGNEINTAKLLISHNNEF